MPPSAEQLQHYRHMAQQAGAHVRIAVSKGKKHLKKRADERAQRRTKRLLKKAGKI